LHTPSYGAKLYVVSIINTTQEARIYIRTVNIERDGEQYGTYYQAVRSYREQGKVKQEVIHLGQHSTAESALESWPQDIQELRRIGRPKQAEKLESKLDCLRRLTEGV
jgi:deoxyribodipyrimidine photolyase